MSRFRDAAALIQHSVEVATLPQTFERVQRVLSDPSKTVADIAQAVSEDPGLSLKLLQIVNSAYYGFSTRVDTISKAVSLIGTQQLRDLALSTAVIQRFRDVPPDLVNMQSFWEHSIAAGLAAREIGRMKRVDNIETYFMAGTLHDVGRLVMFLKMPEEMHDAMRKAEASKELLYITEKKLFGFDHAEVGGELLEALHLPKHLEEAVASHHSPLQTNRTAILPSVVHVADILAHVINLGGSGERLVPKLSNDAWNRVGLTPDCLPEILSAVEDSFKTITHAMLRVH